MYNKKIQDLVNALAAIEELSEPIGMKYSDYEDAIQHYAALQDASVEGIITRNIKDYRYSDIPVLLPTEFHK